MKPFTENDLRVLRARWGRPQPGVPKEIVTLVRRLLATIDRDRADRDPLVTS